MLLPPREQSVAPWHADVSVVHLGEVREWCLRVRRVGPRQAAEPSHRARYLRYHEAEGKRGTDCTRYF